MKAAIHLLLHQSCLHSLKHIDHRCSNHSRLRTRPTHSILCAYRNHQYDIKYACQYRVCHIGPSMSIIRCVVAQSYGQLRECDFGLQPIVRLDLCAMQEKKQDDGYYAVKQSIDITTVEESTHDS